VHSRLRLGIEEKQAGFLAQKLTKDICFVVAQLCCPYYNLIGKEHGARYDYRCHTDK